MKRKLFEVVQIREARVRKLYMIEAIDEDDAWNQLQNGADSYAEEITEINDTVNETITEHKRIG